MEGRTLITALMFEQPPMLVAVPAGQCNKMTTGGAVAVVAGRPRVAVPGTAASTGHLPCPLRGGGREGRQGVTRAAHHIALACAPTEMAADGSVSSGIVVGEEYWQSWCW